ncbi:MAG: DUF6537 domain-containing protein [Burkholderiaceae bacterium]
MPQSAGFSAWGKLAEAVARSFFRLMAYKDEYEVARLYASSEFRRQISAAFEAARLAFNLAPPGPNRTDQRTGRPAKREFGAWVLPVFGVLSRLRVLRGSWLDPFGLARSGAWARGLIEQYERDLLALWKWPRRPGGLGWSSSPPPRSSARLQSGQAGFGEGLRANARGAALARRPTGTDRFTANGQDMDFSLSPELCDLRDRTRAFIAEQVIPLEKSADRGALGQACVAAPADRRARRELLTPHASREMGRPGPGTHGQGCGVREAGYSWRRTDGDEHPRPRRGNT